MPLIELLFCAAPSYYVVERRVWVLSAGAFRWRRNSHVVPIADGRLRLGADVELRGPLSARARGFQQTRGNLLMETLDYWRLCDELSVIQAALLIVGVDPATNQEWILEWEPHKRPDGFEASFAALKHAILAGRLHAAVRRRA